MTFGKQTRVLRENAGIKAVALAERVGLTPAQLSARETDAVSMTKVEFMGIVSALRSMADGLGVALGDVDFSGDED